MKREFRDWPILRLALLGFKILRHLLSQSEVKPKPIAQIFPRFVPATCTLFRVLIGPMDCCGSFVIGQSNYFGFDFTKFALSANRSDC